MVTVSCTPTADLDHMTRLQCFENRLKSVQPTVNAKGTTRVERTTCIPQKEPSLNCGRTMANLVFLTVNLPPNCM